MFATKFHYNTAKQRKVLLRISEKGDRLLWISMPGKGDIRGGALSSIPLTNVRGILVGPCSSTFLRHKSEILLAIL